jgi:hypothetical protein
VLELSPPDEPLLPEVPVVPRSPPEVLPSLPLEPLLLSLPLEPLSLPLEPPVLSLPLEPLAPPPPPLALAPLELIELLEVSPQVKTDWWSLLLNGCGLAGTAALS